jgi:hypothetical protein
MSATKIALDTAITLALQSAAAAPATSPEGSDAKLEEVAKNLSTAIDAYVVSKLEALAIQLKLPTAFAGAGTGVVTISPASFAAYDPKAT